VPGGQPLSSMITAAAGDSTAPISPNTRLRRVQATTPLYFADKAGRVRHLAVDLSARNPSSSAAARIRSKSGGSSSDRRSYGMLRMKARPATASSASAGSARRQHVARPQTAGAVPKPPSRPIHAREARPRPSTARQQGKGPGRNVVAVSPGLGGEGATEVQWVGGTPPPAWSRKQKGWSGASAKKASSIRAARASQGSRPLAGF
jgi:hypothetical protein